MSREGESPECECPRRMTGVRGTELSGFRSSEKRRSHPAFGVASRESGRIPEIKEETVWNM